MLAETVDGSLSEAREMLANVREGLGKPHVLDGRTVDRIIRLYTETLGMADVYRAQLGRWRGDAPDPAGLAEIDRLSAALPELEETARKIVDAPWDEPSLRDRTLRVRLVKYTAGDTEYRLVTSLLDSGRYGIQPLSDPCHGRWGIEEMYKSGKSVRGVRQEPCAAFVPLTLARRFSNRCDGDLNGGDDQPAMRANFRNGLRLVGREIEALFLRQADAVRDSVARIMAGLSRCLQRERPGRGYPRESKRPRSKWIRRPAA